MQQGRAPSSSPCRRCHSRAPSPEGNQVSALLWALTETSRPDVPRPGAPAPQRDESTEISASRNPRYKLQPFSPVPSVGSPYDYYPSNHIPDFEARPQNNPGHISYLAALGSPYSYPFTHGRRNHYPNAHPHVDLNYPPVITKEIQGQYQTYAYSLPQPTSGGIQGQQRSAAEMTHQLCYDFNTLAPKQALTLSDITLSFLTLPTVTLSFLSIYF